MGTPKAEAASYKSSASGNLNHNNFKTIIVAASMVIMTKVRNVDPGNSEKSNILSFLYCNCEYL